MLPAGKEITMWLVRIDSKDDGLHGSVLAAGSPSFAGAAVDEVRAEGDTLHLRFLVGEQPSAFVFRRSEGETAPRRLLGSGTIRAERDFARLERSDAQSLDEQQAMVVQESSEELTKAMAAEAGPAKEAVLRQKIERHAGQPAEYILRLGLIESLARRGAQDEVRGEAERVIAYAAAYGPEMRRQALKFAATQVLASGKLAPLAVEYARRSEQMLEPTTPAEERSTVLRVLVRAFRGAEQEREANQAGERVEEAEKELDRAFEAKALPFEPVPFPGRKGTSQRVALVELFTGAHCGPCVAADLAFDGLLRTFQPQDVVFVQYHLHIPAPDLLANHDAERRMTHGLPYFAVGGTPQFFVNRWPLPAGGGREAARELYTRLRDGLAERLEEPTLASLKIALERHGERIDVTADADGVPRGNAVRLRLLLVEDVVRYLGSNGQRLHHHVFRSFIGGADGVHVSGASVRRQVTLDLAALRTSLRAELAVQPAFKDLDWPLDLKRLKVIGVLEDHAPYEELLQTAQADVPD
jgi:hypothetical protein